MKLKYGMNPNQDYAELEDNDALRLINGLPSVINILDALNSWQLVRELGMTLGMAAAASFKHVSPSGTALEGCPDSRELASCNFSKTPESPLTQAYLKARGADRLASFGDFIALNRRVDPETAKLIRSEVSDGIIAPDYDAEALEILKTKKKGKYIIFAIDAKYVPPAVESRDIFGFRLKQKRNDLEISEKLLEHIAMKARVPDTQIKRDIILGMTSLKYTQSNSIAVVWNGRTIGIGAGQQSRILCSRLALDKANKWYQKTLLDFDFLATAGSQLSKTDKDLLIEQEWEVHFGNSVSLNELEGLCLCSDAFFPQTDNIELAAEYGIQYIAAPMGSVRDADILKCCEDNGITFIDTAVRLFHH
ncbi:MAG: phosphoribosylaminoimidazolecarboxamide formyltransferase [Spirochaetales bacterium]|nr:phosphoribosylaminoimidazolecarboxamide formyltransferase [Spirochaetales bacterium]